MLEIGLLVEVADFVSMFSSLGGIWKDGECAERKKSGCNQGADPAV